MSAGLPSIAYTPAWRGAWAKGQFNLSPSFHWELSPSHAACSFLSQAFKIDI